MAEDTKTVEPKEQQWPEKGRIKYFEGESKLDTNGSFEDTLSHGYKQKDRVENEYDRLMKRLSIAVTEGFADESGSDSGETSSDGSTTTGGIGGRPDFITEEDWEVVLKHCDGVNVDPYLVAAIGWQETHWGKLGLGKKGYTLGMGATESGNVSYLAGLESQIKEVADRLKALKDCSGHMLGTNLDDIASPWTGHGDSSGASKGPTDLVWIQTGAKAGGAMATSKLAGKRPWSKENGVYGYHTGDLKSWYANVKKKYLELKESVGATGTSGGTSLGSGKVVAPAEAQKFYDELFKLMQEGKIDVNDPARRKDVQNGNIALPLVQVILFITQVKKVKLQIGCLNSGHPVISASGHVGRHKYGCGLDCSRINGHHITTTQGLTEFKVVVDALAEITTNETGQNGFEFFGPDSLCDYYKTKPKAKVPTMCKWISGHTNHIHFGLPKKFYPKDYMNTLWWNGKWKPNTTGTSFYASLVWDTYEEYEVASGKKTVKQANPNWID